jgi:hypothetical protein
MEMLRKECPFYYEENDGRESIGFCNAKNPKERDLKGFSDFQARVISCKCMKIGCKMGRDIDWD